MSDSWAVHFSAGNYYLGFHTVSSEVDEYELMEVLYNQRSVGRLYGITPNEAQPIDITLYIIKDPKNPIILYPEEITYDQ